MSFPVDRRRLLFTSAAFGVLPTCAFAQRDDTFEIGNAETATIDGRKWDTPMTGGTTVDAVHRSVLLRFPKAADEIVRILRGGRVLARAELVLGYASYEIVPDGYTVRDGLGRKRWTDDPPSWHIEAFPVRQPWKADRDTGPTFNASVNGKRYWAHYGAADPARDRIIGVMEPQELSIYQHEARFDITPLLATPVVERDPGARLLWLDSKGFLLRKLETYDTRYRDLGDAYEWAMPIGGHGLSFTNPRIVLACRRTTGIVTISMPPDLQAEWEMRAPDGSQPTAVMPTATQVAERGRLATAIRGPARPDWQLQRIAELEKVGGDHVSQWTSFADPANYQTYLKEVAAQARITPRYWMGWEVEDLLLLWHIFRTLMPAPLQDQARDYWKAWLQPDLPTSSFVHPQSKEAIDYWKRTHDWRGRASFFRDGYNYAVSTQNFNHTAAMGALLGGAMIDSANAMADGRHGLEFLLLRFWGFLDGTTQEILDHYYLSISLSGQKMFADFAPLPVDRLMGRILVDRTMEMLITLYHPRLRRFVSSSNRARLSGVLVEQDGIYGALHTISKDGALKYLDLKPESRVKGLSVWGYDFPPGRVAMQSLPSPWAPAWMSGLVDDKPVPFEETSAETTRGTFKPPLWRRSWLGRWHGLASTDIRGGTIDLLAQWTRTPEKSAKMEDLGSLTVRYVINEPDMASTYDGTVTVGGMVLTYQSRNRAIVFTKPQTNRDRIRAGLNKARGIAKLATVIALWNFAEGKSWDLYIDDKKIESFPQRMTGKQRLFLHDGVSYIAILPLPATDLGRDVEIEIGPGGGGKAPPSNEPLAPALIISQYNMKRPEQVPLAELELGPITSRTYGGFVLEMGDVEQYGSFEAFVKHIQATTLTATWRDDRNQMDISYRTGDDLMEAGFTTDFTQPTEWHFSVDPGQQEKAIPYRRLNGKWPYLSGGLERDTTWSQQGVSGRLEKNGAVLTTEAGRKSYLLSDPMSGGVVAYNPLPDPQTFALATKDGMTLRADGKVGLLRAEYRPWAHEIDITHALKPDQSADDFARTFTVTGLKDAPKVTVNDKPVPTTAIADGFQFPL